MTAVFLISAESTDGKAIEGTPREVLYGKEQRAYATRELANRIAADWNGAAKGGDWTWRYEVTEVDSANLEQYVGEYLELEPLA